MIKITRYTLIASCIAIISVNAYAADATATTSKAKMPTQDEIVEKARQDAIHKTQNAKYSSHNKKLSPQETAAQIHQRHGGAIAATAPSTKKLSSQDEIIEKARQDAIRKTQNAKYSHHNKKLSPQETASQIQKRHADPATNNQNTGS